MFWERGDEKVQKKIPLMNTSLSAAQEKYVMMKMASIHASNTWILPLIHRQLLSLSTVVSATKEMKF